MSDVLATITTPISGENPLGENINYEPAFDTLKSEIGKLGEIDYQLLENTALSLLREKSKDARVMAFLSFGYLRNENWEQLADVFEGLAQLAAESYDAMHPERPRAKQNAFKWLSETRYADMIAMKKPPEADYPHVVRLRESLAKLKPILEEKFPEGSPFPSGLFSAAQKWETATKPKPKPEPAAAGGATAAGGGGAVGAADPMTTPKEAQGIGRKVALFLIEHEPNKSMGYRILRAVRWDMLEKAPPSDGEKTQLPAPNEQQRAYFQGLIGKEDWATALVAAEKAFVAGANHLWLDLQRISATSCANRVGYDGVGDAIKREVALLLKRMPELVDLTFSDGTPFCDAATKDWIALEVAGVLGGGETVAGASAPADDGGFEAEKKEINAMVAAGKVEQALDFLHKQIRESSSERDNFRRSMLLGNLLLANKRPDIALAIIESLDNKISTYNLDKWDPELAVEAWTLLIQAYKVAKAGKPQNVQIALSEKQNTILQQLSRTDPKSAFKITI